MDEDDSSFRNVLIITLSTCRTLLDKLDSDDIDELALTTRLEQVCELIEIRLQL